MPTFIVDNDEDFTLPVVLNPEDEHHLVRVMRVKAGELFQVTNNRGKIAILRVTKANPFQFEVMRIAAGEEPSPITVGLPLIEQDRLEWTVEKLTELNIATIQLVDAERSQSHELKPAKFERLQKIAIAAQKQCGRAYPLEILPPVRLAEIPFPTGAIKIVASLTVLSSVSEAMHSLSPLSWKYVLIGPEGGFSATEEQFLSGADVFKISLGEPVLRTETAAVALAVLVKYC